MNKVNLAAIALTMFMTSSAFAFRICGPGGHCCISNGPSATTGSPRGINIGCTFGKSKNLNYNSCQEALSSNELSIENKNFIRSNIHCQGQLGNAKAK